MLKFDENTKRNAKIENLYPDLTSEEQTEAEDTLKRYLNLVWRIYCRLHHEKRAKFDENPFKR